MTEVRFVDPEHFLHRETGQAHLAADDPAPGGDASLDVDHLDAIGVGERQICLGRRRIDSYAGLSRGHQAVGDFPESFVVHSLSSKRNADALVILVTLRNDRNKLYNTSRATVTM